MTGRILWFATVLLLTCDGTVFCETLTPVRRDGSVC